MTTALDQKILDYLAAHPNVPAWNIGRALGIDKQKINSLLYGALKGKVIQDNSYCWQLTDDENTNKDEITVTTWPDTPLSRLSRYYLACLGQDDAGISVFASSKFGDSDYRELDQMPMSNPDFWSSEPVRALMGRIRKDKSRLVMYFGYPAVLGHIRSKKGWEGFLVEPIFLFPVQFDERMQPTLEWGFPVINQKAFRRLTNSQGPEVMEELVQLERELGLIDADHGPDLDELIQRLHAIRPEWPWLEAVDPESPRTEPPLASLNEAGIYNRAILLLGERSPFTQGLEAELTQLARLKPGAADGTALGSWLSDNLASVAAEDIPLLDVLPMNSEQRASVHSALVKPLTIITGPPGTGKSQVVTNLLINAAWRGQKVLFASKNNKAVDVVEIRVNELGSRPVLLRLGANQYQGRLAEYLIALLSAKSTSDDSETYRHCLLQHEKLVKQIKTLDDESLALMTLRNQVDQGEQRVEGLRSLFTSADFAKLRYLNLKESAKTLDAFLYKLQLAEFHRQSWFIRIFWMMLAKNRFEQLQSNIEHMKQIFPLLGVKMPDDAPDHHNVVRWREFADQLIEQRKQAALVQDYFALLDLLQSARSFEVISAEHARVMNDMAENAEELWTSWLRLQPERLRASDRSLLSRYNSVLKMVIESGSDGMLSGSVYKEYNSLFPKVSHLLPCWAITALSAKGRIPFEPGYFDLVIIDEASQCDIASALPLLYRAKRAVILGDPKQLSHISGMMRGQDVQLMDKFNLLQDYVHWGYSFNSLFDLATGLVGGDDIVSLRDHHRCHADIIEFSNQEFYEGNLRVATRYNKLRRPTPDAAGIDWQDVQGTVIRPDGGGAVNEMEAKAVVALLHRLILEKGYRGSVGVVSPFRAQANRIRLLVTQDTLLNDHLLSHDFLVDTVHKFQGDERDVMIFSPVVSRNTPKGALGFLANNGNLFNVAITRARAQLWVVGDRAACSQCGIPYLERFVSYVSELNNPSNSQREIPVGSLGAEYPVVSNPALVSDWERIFYKALYAAGIQAIPQYTIEKYTLDFALFDGERRLNIEVDGERYHRNWSGELCRRDQLRNQRMYELDWDVMRFWVYEIRDDIDGSILKIKKWLQN